MARRVLPFVVVVWASLAMIGGAVHLANEAAAAQGSVAKAGLGLCAVSLAFFVRKVGGSTPPSVATGAPVPGPLPLLRSVAPSALRLPPSTGPPLPLLLRVSRT